MDAMCLFSHDQNISRLATKLCAILSSKVNIVFYSAVYRTIATLQRFLKLIFDNFLTLYWQLSDGFCFNWPIKMLELLEVGFSITLLTQFPLPESNHRSCQLVHL